MPENPQAPQSGQTPRASEVTQDPAGSPGSQGSQGSEISASRHAPPAEPPHAPEADAAIDLAAYGEDFIADPYPYYAKLRAQGPVHRVRTPYGQEAWLVVGHEAVRAALADPRLGKDWSSANLQRVAGDETPLFTNMLDADPPHHTRLRKLVAKEFTSRRVEALRPRVQRITDELLDAMLAAPDGRADLIEALAFPLPMTVICELLGVPSMDRDAFRAWSHELVSPTSPEAAQQAVQEMSAYLTTLVEALRREPGDGLLSDLVRTSDEDGDRLSHEEVIGTAFLLLVAGHETTVNLISNGVRALLEHPAQLAAVRADDGLVDNTVEEMLRYDGPVETATWRCAAEPVELGGTVIPTGSAVLISLASASRDPERFAGADDFDITRDPRGHAAFGHGIHFCLGAPLARLEGRIALRSLLDRCPGLALDSAADAPAWRPGLLMRAMDRLPIHWGG
ncbi:cytochrome P450 [Streptomyces sp. CB02959]|uniref:cytochrome P450 family protein n=1 Tax=Streptomyces sp. CB02959 TaxID=2020330 RepID=UPI000C276A5D|nr:cytochrome P450 [Streptomyces sp. CB02959]PJN36239.1 cytochrome P450 [Streptomyces sp. CB02959]